MPTATRKRRVKPSKILSGLAFKVGSSFFSASFGGFLSQYMNSNTTGMLIFAAAGFIGLIVIVTGLALEE